ncbi:hypothetical protein RR48_13547 [Papilio machaon]|uniref:Uncharacterized protein n=1 Tax=Papilio machaon TaxID=76193 RepID=A0A194REW8_PAPMA|nr:hypothetical protein RR48_13547 [Papilio machaon]
MGSSQKDIELSPVKSDDNKQENRPHVLVQNYNAPVNDEEDVIIGRFRKISSAKSMAATNGNIQYPAESSKSEDIEAGLHFKKEISEKDKLLPNPKSDVVDTLHPKSPVAKSSFRDMEKPSRFKDHPSATRFKRASPTFLSSPKTVARNLLIDMREVAAIFNMAEHILVLTE